MESFRETSWEKNIYSLTVWILLIMPHSQSRMSLDLKSTPRYIVSFKLPPVSTVLIHQSPSITGSDRHIISLIVTCWKTNEHTVLISFVLCLQSARNNNTNFARSRISFSQISQQLAIGWCGWGRSLPDTNDGLGLKQRRADSSCDCWRSAVSGRQSRSRTELHFPLFSKKESS